jgi:hypothetical protein
MTQKQHQIPLRTTRLGLAGFALALGLGVATTHTAFAADSDAAAKPDLATLPGGTYASIAKLPDLSGPWLIERNTGEFPASPPLKPDYAKQYAGALAKLKAQGKPLAPIDRCAPYALPMSMQHNVFEMLMKPGQILIPVEANSTVRHIYTDGRAIPDDPDLKYQGSSVGHWDGDTLIVDTVGFLPNTWLAPGLRHSAKLHIEERMRLAGRNTLQIKTTIFDPVEFTKPWTYTTKYKRHSNQDLHEYMCKTDEYDDAE